MLLLFATLFVLGSLIVFCKKCGWLEEYGVLTNLEKIVSSVIALVLTMFSGYLSWKILFNSTVIFPDFLSGRISIYVMQSKKAEFYALYIGIILFFLFWILSTRLYILSIVHDGVRKEVVNLSIISLIPTVIMLGQSVRSMKTNILLFFSVSLVILFLVFAYCTVLAVKKGVLKPERFLTTCSSLMLGSLFVFMSDLGINILFSRIYIPIINYYKVGILTLILFVFMLVYLIYNIFIRTNKNIILLLKRFLMISQIPVPLLFMVLLSPPVKRLDGTFGALQYKPILYIIVLLLISLSLYDIFRRAGKGETLNSLVSPWTLVSILIYVQSGLVDWPSVSPDEYHSGEVYLPWWLYQNYGYLPFVDYQPSRGLANYLPGFLSWFLYDGSFAGQKLVVPHHNAIYVFLAFFSLRLIAGNLAAFISVFSFWGYAGGLTGGLILSFSCLALLYYGLLNLKPIPWLWIWGLLSIINTLFMVAEGSTMVLATLPAFFYMLWKAYSENRKDLIRSIAVLFLVSLSIMIYTNIDSVILGAIKYLLEQAKVNEIAYGIPWSWPKTIEERITYGYFYQFIRFSWLFIVLSGIIMLVKNLNKNIRSTLLYGAIIIMGIVIIPRAAGRIDPTAFSRPGMTSIAFIAMGFPLLFLTRNQIQNRSLLMIVFAFLCGLIGNQSAAVNIAWSQPNYVINEPKSTISEKSVGLYNIGEHALMDTNQLQRQIQIKSVLDQILQKGETYYDLTNHNADYGYQGLPSPIADTAFYNMPTVSQQRRAIKELETKAVPLVLVKGENILHDGGTLPLRCWVLYDYVLEKYIPFEDKYQRIWMIRKGYENRLQGLNGYQLKSNDNMIPVLDKAFLTKDLLYLPANWGRSINSLSRKMTETSNILEDGKVIAMKGVKQIDENTWEVSGSDPYIIYSVPKQQNLSSGMLYIEFDRKVTGNYLQVFWKNKYVPVFVENQSFVFKTSSERYLIPLDCAPSFLLGKSIDLIRIDLPNDYQGIFSVKQIKLYQRNISIR